MGEHDLVPGEVPESRSAQILSGPEDWIWDNVYDWIQNAVTNIYTTITDWIQNALSNMAWSVAVWISNLWDNVSSFFTSTWERVTSGLAWLRDTVSSYFAAYWQSFTDWYASLWNSISSAFTSTWDSITSGIGWLWDNVSSFFETTWQYITTWTTWLWTEISQSLGQISSTILEGVGSTLSGWWTWFTDRLMDFGSWVGRLFDTIGDWFSQDVPGASPRWTGIFENIGHWFATWFYEFPRWFFADAPERVAYGLSESFRWVGDTFAEIFDAFRDNMLQLTGTFSPGEVEAAPNRYSIISRVGFTSLATLTGMTVAGELLHPLKRLGLGNIAAMIYDMTNYKEVTGSFMRTFTRAALQQPLTYFFNEHFRPYVLSPRDFMELMARDAFRAPERLQNPELVSSVAALAPAGGSALESEMIGYYGYPGQYHGLFRELSYTRLGYFALAGIARAGFWQEPWFIEALSRTGYSATARDALLLMYREQVREARQRATIPLIRRAFREGFFDADLVRAHLETVAGMENMTDTRIFAMELERELSIKDTAVDIILQAFARGIIPEGECYGNLAGLIVAGEIVDLHVTRTKLGLIRRVTLPTPEPEPAYQFVEED